MAPLVVEKLERARDANEARAALFVDTILPSIPDGESIYVYAPTVRRAQEVLALIPDDINLGNVRARSMHQSDNKYRGDAPHHAVFLDYNEFTKKFWFTFVYPFLQVGRSTVLVENGSVPSKPWFDKFKPQAYPACPWKHYKV
jgi:hypothetical protein